MGFFSFRFRSKKEVKQASISDFVNDQFSTVDRLYGKYDQDQEDQHLITSSSTPPPPKESSQSEASVNEKEDSTSTQITSNTNSKTNQEPKREKTPEEVEEEEAYATLTYLALLTCLYLPLLLFLWIRRSVFGATSLIRSLFLGHLLRLLLAFLLLPPSTTKSFLPSWLWNWGVRIHDKAHKVWNSEAVQNHVPLWVHAILAFLFPDGHLADGKKGPVSSSSLNGSGVGKEKESWPPPALMGLAAFTVLAFVVHPDGLTWMIFGQLSEWIHETAHKGAETIRMIRDGSLEITPSLISSTLATIIIIFTVVNHVYTNKYHTSETSSKNRPKDSAVSKKHKHKRGKKGSGKMRHSHSGGGSGGRGRIRSSGSANASSNLSVDSDGPNTQHQPRSRSRSNSPTSVRSQTVVDNSSGSQEGEAVKVGSRNSNDETINNATSKTTNREEKRSRKSGKKQMRIASNQQRQPQHASESIAEDDKSVSSFPSCASSHATTQSSTVDSCSVSNSTRNKKGRGKKGKKSPGSQSASAKVQGSYDSNVVSQNQLLASGSIEETKKMRIRVGGCKVVQSGSNERLTATKCEKPVLTSNKSRNYPSRPSAMKNPLQTREIRHANKQSELRSPSSVSSVKSEISYDGKASEGRSVPLTPSRILSNPNTPSREYAPDYQTYSKTSFFSEAMLDAGGSSRRNRRRSFTDPERIQNRHTSQEPISPSTSASSQHSEVIMQPGLLSSLPENASKDSSRYQSHESLFGRTNDPNPVVSKSPADQKASYEVQYSPGKLELATFLAQVGLFGNDAQSLLLDMDDIDALERLTNEDLEVTYSIGPRIRNEIFSKLDARRVERRHSRNLVSTGRGRSWAPNGMVKPPPGLEPVQDSLAVSNMGGTYKSSELILDSNISRMDEPVLPYLTTSASNSSSGTNFGFSSTFDKAIGAPQRTQASAPVADSSANNFKLHDLTPLDPPPLQSLNGNISQGVFPSLNNKDEEIEADLRALGGQMAGSILDF